MKLRLMTGTAIAAIMAARAAYGADLPRKAPAVLPAPQFSWTGCHAGVNLGLGNGQTGWRDTVPDGNIDGNTATNRTARTDISGSVAGGQLGCDMQFSGNWVAGIGGSLNWSNIASSSQDQFNAPWNLRDQVDWYGTVTGRVGASIDQVLLYGRGGVAFAHNRFAITNSGVSLGTPSDTRVGWTVGAGLEWAFSSHWSAFLEGNYYGFGSKTITLNNVPGFINPPFTVGVKPSFETFTFGVNYRFSGPGSPY